MAAAASIDLSTIPAPSVVEELSFESIFSDMLADLRVRDTAFTALVESDPAYKVLEVAAYREFLLRQRVNDAALQTMLAYAEGSNLDQIGARYGIGRKTIAAAIDTDDAVMEEDEDFRSRILLSLDRLSAAGPTNAYVYWALTVSTIKDAKVSSPSPGEVLVTVLSSAGDGTPSNDDISSVSAILNADDVRPLTDNVTVASPTIVSYTIEATIYTNQGPDNVVVFESAKTAVQKYTTAQHKLGADVTLSGIYAALHQAGVHRVALSAPQADIITTDLQAPYCTAINLTNGGLAT